MGRHDMTATFCAVLALTVFGFLVIADVFRAGGDFHRLGLP
jgi:hypothetical protein